MAIKTIPTDVKCLILSYNPSSETEMGLSANPTERQELLHAFYLSLIEGIKSESRRLANASPPAFSANLTEVIQKDSSTIASIKNPEGQAQKIKTLFIKLKEALLFFSPTPINWMSQSGFLKKPGKIESDPNTSQSYKLQNIRSVYFYLFASLETQRSNDLNFRNMLSLLIPNKNHFYCIASHIKSH